MNKILPTLGLLLFSFIHENLNSQTITRLLGCVSNSDSLYVIDTNTFSVKKILQLTASNTVDGVNGLARHPGSGNFYLVYKLQGSSNRRLGTLNPATGSITNIGVLGDNFSQITFNGNNTLLGVTGDGANDPETVFRINITNASPTLLQPLGNGDDGEVISYSPFNNKVYHWSGYSGDFVFESADDTLFTNITDIPFNYNEDEVKSAVYAGNGMFLTNNSGSDFHYWDTLGNATYRAPFSEDLKGLAFITCSRAITGTFTFCAGNSTQLTAAAGGTSYQWYFNGSPVSTGTLQTYTVTNGGIYNCIVDDGCGPDSSSVGITVQQLSAPSLSVNSTHTMLCSGSSATLTPGGATSYTWNPAIPLSGVISPTITTSYTVTGVGANGCTSTMVFTQSVTICSGINTLALSKKNEIVLYPNPNKGDFIIELEQNSEIIIHNILGEVVFTNKMDAGKHKINLHSESSGVYFLSAYNNQHRSTVKIIKE